MLARAIHREYFLLHCLKKEIATAKELDLRQLGKVLIFRYRQTDRTFLLYIDYHHHLDEILPHGPNIAKDI